jgi:hypothetical protein
MPMLPGYHFIVVGLWGFHPPLELLTLGRLVTALLALLGFTVFALAWRRLHDTPAGPPTLLLALLPLTQPFTAMLYTDVPGLAFTLAAVWAHLRGWRAFAALVLTGAIFIRQTNLAWAGFLIAWELLRTDEPRRNGLRRAGWMLALVIAAGITIAWAGRLTLGQQHGNDFRLNVATIHFTGLLLLGLGLPVWLGQLPAVLKHAVAFGRARPALAAALAAGGAAAAALFARGYANPHAWNRDLFWDGCSFTLLRNWPLVWIDTHPALKIASGINLVVMTAALGAVIARQRHRLPLWLALGCGMALPLTNSLVEPRYFIPVAGMLLLFLELSDRTWRLLIVWWALLCALHAPFVAAALSLW